MKWIYNILIKKNLVWPQTNKKKNQRSTFYNVIIEQSIKQQNNKQTNKHGINMEEFRSIWNNKIYLLYFN